MSYDPGRRRQARSVFGYWVPLIVTVTAATIAVGAWVWSERRDSDSDEYPPGDAFEEGEDAAYARRLRDQRRGFASREEGNGQGESEFMEVGPEGVMVDKFGRHVDLSADEQGKGWTDTNFMSRMNDVIRRTPSPQQIYDGASKRVAAGVAAVGRGLKSIQEEGKDDFVDHERWSEEADHKDRLEDGSRATEAGVAGVATSAAAAGAFAGATEAPGAKRETREAARMNTGRKRLVAVVVSAEQSHGFSGDGEDSSYHIEHASILSHLINHVDSDMIDLLVLIYAPQLKTHPLSDTKRRPSSSGDSSFSHISGREADMSSDEQRMQQSTFNSLSTQATALTSHPTHVMPFTSPAGHVHILRHIAPSLVYVQESLTGEDGQLVKQIEGWVGQVVVVVGADVGAGLVDTETEDEGDRRKEKKQWWQDSSRVGLGKVEVVDGDRVGDDWSKRLGMK